MPILKQIYINYVSVVYHESYFVNLYHERPSKLKIENIY